MLFMRMDLLNYQYLDKMNNNIGILCYEGNSASPREINGAVARGRERIPGSLAGTDGSLPGTDGSFSERCSLLFVSADVFGDRRCGLLSELCFRAEISFFPCDFF